MRDLQDLLEEALVVVVIGRVVEVLSKQGCSGRQACTPRGRYSRMLSESGKKEGGKVERKNIYDRKKVSWKKKASEQIVSGRHELIRVCRRVFSRESKPLRQLRLGDADGDVY